MTSLNVATPLHMARTIGLCFLVALMEGLDLQASGIAAQGMAAAFELDKLQMGWVFSAGIFGLLPGAFAGGWLSDRIGRKRVLIASVALFGLFSLATAHAWDLSTLIIARFLTGVGLGAALPNLIALTSEAAGTRLRGSAVSLMYCGVPLGAACAAGIGIAGYTSNWQLVFHVGGIAPLLILPLLWIYLLESSESSASISRRNTASLRADLLGQGATWLLWLSFFFTLMIVYILINWLPSLLIGQGFSPVDASWVMLALQIGAAIGTLTLGVLMARLPAWATAVLVYLGILGALAGLGIASDLRGMLIAGFIAGFFATGGQGVLYALAPWFYPARVRATGVGAAVAVGRLGAMSGPLVAGQMLALGTGTVGVLLVSAPGIVVAALALFRLVARRPTQLPD
jgi:AAHS family 3-hydroxyphenylpropionic acid transporter